MRSVLLCSARDERALSYSKVVKRVRSGATGEHLMALSEQTCVPCRGGVPALTADEIVPLAAQIDHWTVVRNHHLKKDFPFPDFASALAFVNAVGTIAETQSHHPDIALAWGKVSVTIWTHKIDGLTESDFILAAKVDAITGELANS